MYTGYQIYQAERPKSAREQREIDMGNAKLVEAVGRFARLLARPVRPRRQTWRLEVRGTRRAGGARPGGARGLRQGWAADGAQRVGGYVGRAYGGIGRRN